MLAPSRVHWYEKGPDPPLKTSESVCPEPVQRVSGPAGETETAVGLFTQQPVADRDLNLVIDCFNDSYHIGDIFTN